MIAELPFPDTLFGQIFQMTSYIFGAFFLSIVLGQVDILSLRFLLFWSALVFHLFTNFAVYMHPNEE